MDGPRLQRGGGGGYARFRIIISGVLNFKFWDFFWWGGEGGGGGKLNSIKQLYAGYWC